MPNSQDYQHQPSCKAVQGALLSRRLRHETSVSNAVQRTRGTICHSHITDNAAFRPLQSLQSREHQQVSGISRHACGPGQFMGLVMVAHGASAQQGGCVDVVIMNVGDQLNHGLLSESSLMLLGLRMQHAPCATARYNHDMVGKLQTQVNN